MTQAEQQGETFLRDYLRVVMRRKWIILFATVLVAAVAFAASARQPKEYVIGAAGPQKYIVCNADEGDSGTFSDRMVMEDDPYVLIEGMTIAGLAVGATKGYIYLRSEYPHAEAVLLSIWRV